MPKFSSNSLSRLATCHKDLQVLFNEVIKYFDCSIMEGHRNKEDQEKAFQGGFSKLHYPHGKHNSLPSNAVDALPYPINFNDETLHTWFGGFVLGVAKMLKDQGKITHDIRWGGSWNGLGKMNTPSMLNDVAHFELVI